MSRRGPLQVEAAISATHCRAASAAGTNWNEIAALYCLLEELRPTPARGMNRKDWRTVSPEDVKCDSADALRDLVPMLRADLAPARGEITTWLDKLVGDRPGLKWKALAVKKRLGVAVDDQESTEQRLEAPPPLEERTNSR
jgi:hypothetical protein